MSFINSVLSSIGDREGRPPSTQNTEPSGKIAIVNQRAPNSKDTGKTPIVSALPSNNNKRKAEDPLPKANDKIVRTDQNGVRMSTIALSINSRRPSPMPTDQKVSNKPSLKTIPYRGTSRPSGPDDALPNKAPPKEPKRSSTAPPAPAQLVPKRGTTKPPAVVSPATPAASAAEGARVPKKGSYAEIMARAKATSNTPPVGVIKHQAKDKKALSDKKALLLQEKGLSGKPGTNTKNRHSRNSSGDVSGGSRPGSSGKSEGPAKKKAPEIAYKGTAKPKPQPTYKGTMKPASSAALVSQKKSFTAQDDRSRSVSTNRPVAAKGRRQDYSEDEDEDDEGEDYDESGSDMEAGYSDVEEEETKATRIARKEDEFEARMEAEMKRQKEARKRRELEIARNQRRNNYD